MCIVSKVETLSRVLHHSVVRINHIKLHNFTTLHNVIIYSMIITYESKEHSDNIHYY